MAQWKRSREANPPKKPQDLLELYKESSEALQLPIDQWVKVKIKPEPAERFATVKTVSKVLAPVAFCNVEARNKMNQKMMKAIKDASNDEDATLGASGDFNRARVLRAIKDKEKNKNQHQPEGSNRKEKR